VAKHRKKQPGKPRGQNRAGLKAPWRPGETGNPNGVPEWYRKMRAILRSHAEAALPELVQLARQRKNPKVQLAALETIIDRAGLQPFKQEPDKTEHSGVAGVRLVLPVEFVKPKPPTA
jgi:hypothetical protein